MVKWFIAAILVLPLAEIAAFVLVAMAIGLGPAFGLLMLTSILGALVLRRAGRGQLAHFRTAVSDNGATGIEADAGGLLTVLAGLLLFLPGFLTDLAGAVLLIGPVQRWCGKRFRRRWTVRSAPADPAVVDLTPGEWQPVPERRIDSDSSRGDRD
jgi:UPF0716 protein FxsA